jgi:hypothetical protein
MLQQGVIQPSGSPWASPVVLVKKKDGGTRFCVDYRKVNALTKRDAYPLPRIDDCINALGGNTLFSSLDLVAGYWQIPLAQKDKQKTAFITPKGFFKFNVLPFGLMNAGATFQRYMDMVVAGLKWICLLIYLDDLCIFSKHFEDHLLSLRVTFERFQRYRLKLKPSKCHLFQKEFLYLGYIISAKGIRVNPKKIAAIIEIPAPKNVKELRSFLGMCNYYRRFI